MNWKKLFIILFVIALLGSLFVYIFVYNKPHPDYLTAKAVYSVEAQALFNQYRSDTDQSNSKYTGQVIEISGTVTNIEHIDSLVVVVFAFDDGMFGPEGVRCTLLESENKKAENNLQGKEIQIKGLCTGYNETDVILEKCSII